MPDTGLVTAYCPLTTTAAGETLVQTVVETRLVVDCKVNPVALVGHVKMKLAPEGTMVKVGAGALTDPNVRLNTVPLPELRLHTPSHTGCCPIKSIRLADKNRRCWYNDVKNCSDPQ